jgi:MoxR-like ATPase
MVILKGPPGSGKTATVKVAAREMKFLLKEWITPINSNQMTEDFDGKNTCNISYSM